MDKSDIINYLTDRAKFHENESIHWYNMQENVEGLIHKRIARELREQVQVWIEKN